MGSSPGMKQSFCIFGFQQNRDVKFYNDNILTQK